jgi:hypothetical protein
MMTRRQRAKTRRVAQIAAVTALAASMSGAAIALVVSQGSDPGVSGPLAVDRPARSGFAARVTLGAAYRYGAVVVSNHDVRPVVLDDVRLEGAANGMSLVGAYVIPGNHTPDSVGFAAGFPAPGRRETSAVELTGYRLEAGKSAEVVVGLRPRVAGAATARAVWIDYSALQRRFQVRLPRSLRLCTDATGDCSPVIRG